MIGSQATLTTREVAAPSQRPCEALGIPVYLSGMARGLLGPTHPLQMRHKRKEALREADLVMLAGIAERLPARLRTAGQPAGRARVGEPQLA